MLWKGLVVYSDECSEFKSRPCPLTGWVTLEELLNLPMLPSVSIIALIILCPAYHESR
jgi:hypothetical protein